MKFKHFLHATAHSTFCRGSLAALLFLPISLAFSADAFYSDWMSKNKDKLKDMSVNQVTILGSHDAASCDVSFGNPPCTGYLTHNGKHIKRNAKQKDVESGRCQSASVMDQLLAGIRYLDMRIAHQKKVYWSVHMWLSTPLFGDNGVFTQVKAFLKDHPDEIIIMNINELYSDHGPMNRQQTESFYKNLHKEFGAMLVQKGDFASTTLGNIWEGKARIIVVGDPSADTSEKPFVWDANKVDSRWMDVSNPELLCSKLDSVVDSWKDGEYSGNLRILQAMTTAGHKISDAAKTNPLISRKLTTDWKDCPMNVIQVDDSVNSGLMPVIIERNLNRNQGRK